MPSLEHLSKCTQEFQYWLFWFIHEIRKKNDSEYSPNTLHHVVSGVMCHIRYNLGKPEIDFTRAEDSPTFTYL